jgi:hypothetical protein
VESSPAIGHTNPTASVSPSSGPPISMHVVEVF